MKTKPHDVSFRSAKVRKSSVKQPLYTTFLYLISKYKSLNALSANMPFVNTKWHTYGA